MKPGAESECGPAQLRVTFRCDLAEVRSKVERVRKFLVKSGCAEKVALACELALVEACTNAIRHVSPAGKRLPIIVEARAENAQIEFRVTDHTSGFNWPKQPVLPGPESETGRGVFLIHSIMDSTQYIRGRGANLLVLRKSV